MYRHYDARPISGVTWASDPRYVPGSHTVRAEAVIERDGSILLIKVDDAGFVHYSLPGGGVEAGESVRGGLFAKSGKRPYVKRPSETCSSRTRTLRSRPPTLTPTRLPSFAALDLVDGMKVFTLAFPVSKDVNSPGTTDRSWSRKWRTRQGGADGVEQARHGARRLHTHGMSRGALDLTPVR